MSNNLLLRRRMLMQAGGSPTPPTPITPHPFSVSANKQVYFSLGNLQWSATNGGTTATTHATADGTAEGTWRFAPNQWDVIGNANANKSSTYTGWVDLFGYGTSGYNGYEPYLRVNSDPQYPPSGITNTNYDWGVYNAIYNPSTQNTDPAGTWRLLTRAENTYIYNSRTTASGIRYAKATVNGVNGVVLIPDDWNGTYIFNSPNVGNVNYSTNAISLADFATLDSEGAVFITAGGYDYNSSYILEVNASCYYWLSDYYGPNSGSNMYMASNNIYINDYKNKRQGLNVRLVKDVN